MTGGSEVELVFKIVSAVGVLFAIVFGIYAIGQPERLRKAEELSDLVGYRNLAYMAFEVPNWALACGIVQGAVPMDANRFRTAKQAFDAIKLNEIRPPTLTRHFVHIGHLTHRTHEYSGNKAVSEKHLVESINELKRSLENIDKHLIDTAKVAFDKDCFASLGRGARQPTQCVTNRAQFEPGKTSTSGLNCRLTGSVPEG